MRVVNKDALKSRNIKKSRSTFLYLTLYPHKKNKAVRWRVRRNVAVESPLSRCLRSVGRVQRDINRMWERECFSPARCAISLCCPSVSFDIGNHSSRCCTSITAPSSHRLPIWLEGIATWFPIWNTRLHFALRHVNALPSLSSILFMRMKNRRRRGLFFRQFLLADF